MNIFATDNCPVQSAINLDDKRVVKMILETAQMLSFVAWSLLPETDKILKDRVSGMYKARRVSFAKHPCTLWAAQSRSNTEWLLDHGLAMCLIYTKIYHKKHKSEKVLRQFASFLPMMEDKGLTPFANCTEDKVSGLPIITKYQQFMVLKWTKRDGRPPVWRKRKPPVWFNTPSD